MCLMIFNNSGSGTNGNATPPIANIFVYEYVEKYRILSLIIKKIGKNAAYYVLVHFVCETSSVSAVLQYFRDSTKSQRCSEGNKICLLTRTILCLVNYILLHKRVNIL